MYRTQQNQPAHTTANTDDGNTARGTTPERPTLHMPLPRRNQETTQEQAPGGGRFCARGPSYISWTSSSLMTVADFCLREEWCVASATAIATATRSCRNMERRRRSLRRRALPVPPPASPRSAMGRPLRSKLRLPKKQHKPV